jgi:ABC-type transport system substrate-binding protein
MSAPPAAPRSRPRHRWAAALAGLLSACAVGGVGVGQPPGEEEDPKAGGVKKKVVVEDDPSLTRPKGPAPGLGTAPDVRLDELVRAAAEVAHPKLKEFYLLGAVPHDRLTTKTGGAFIKPIPVAGVGNLPAQFGVVEIGSDGKIGQTLPVSKGDVKKIDYFEELAAADANALLAMKPYGTGAGPDGMTAKEQLTAAERVLAAALRFHDYARARNLRTGKGWDEIRKPLADRLREVRLLDLKHAAAVADWPRLRAAGSRLMQAYPKDPEVATEVAAVRVLEARRLLASDKHFDHAKAKELLDEFEARYPGGGGEGVRAVRAELNALANRAFTRAKDKKAVNDLSAARDALAQAAALDPTVPGLRDMQRELKAGYQTLYVGVRQYPQNLSPITARTDGERQAVELMFEGLLAEVPPPDEGAGVRYRTGAAAAMPGVVAAGREFTLRTQELGPDTRDALGAVRLTDVVGTVKLLQARPASWAAYPLPWLSAELPTPRTNTAVRLGFQKGHPDPRALCTFKLYPAQWLIDNGKAIDDPAFAEKPTGGGPYRLHANPRADGNTPREMVFLDNPLYGRWRDRNNQPYIKEIRLVEVSKVHNLVDSVRQGSLHVLPDVPTAAIDQLQAAVGNKAQVYTAATNRRVHLLAVNHTRPHLQSKILRQGLAMAVNREAILAEVFRAGKSEYHRQMGGPFPPKCWAGVKGPGDRPVPLYNRDLAVNRLKAYLGDMGAKDEVTLAYAEDEPGAKDACDRIKAQVEDLFKDLPGRRLKVLLEPLPARDLMLRVEDEQRYELAYVSFDYPDEWYPFALGAMLDPAAAARGGRNWFAFGAKGADAEDQRLVRLLEELRDHRDFAQLKAKTDEVHKLFNECVPFIPLWQLDRHTLVHNAVKVYTDDSDVPVSPRVLDPTTLFQGVARWRLEE